MLGIIAGLVVGEGRGSGNEHLYPNVNEADLMKWKVKNVSLATSPRAKGKTRIDGCRLENERPERSVKKCLFVCVCMRMVGGGRVAEL